MRQVLAQGESRWPRPICSQLPRCHRETTEPEEVLDFQFSGDGIMVFFDDLVPCPDPTARAVNWQWRCGKPPVH